MWKRVCLAVQKMEATDSDAMGATFACGHAQWEDGRGDKRPGRQGG